MHTHFPRKRFGQHFLIDTSIIEQIVALINPQMGDHLVEIGPGLGALTVPILKKTKQLKAIELDFELIPALEKRCSDLGNLEIYSQDALTFPFDTLAVAPQKLRLFGNLPYNISTPLLFHLLKYAHHIQDMHFMLQKEVVDRLVATPHSSDYGRLTIMLQYRCATYRLLSVPPIAFSPPPKVESAVVRIIPHATPPYAAIDLKAFENLVKQAFGMRRKTIKNALKNQVDPQIWQITKIDIHKRPEDLSIQDYVELSNAITRYYTT